MPQFGNGILSRLENKLISNPNYLLVLAVFNCAILMNFHEMIWKKPVTMCIVFIMACFTFINFKYWWAAIINIIISFFYFVIKFPRLANHSNIELFVEIIILSLLVYKIIYPRLKFPLNLTSYIFRVSVVSIYFYTGFHKLNTDFFNPCVSCVNDINSITFKNFTGLDFSISETFSRFFQFSTIFFEMILPFGLFWNRTRKLIAVLLLSFHFYLSFSYFADFGSLASFLILGCIIDFDSNDIPKSVVKSLRFYLFFALIAILLKPTLTSLKIDTQLINFIHGIIFNTGWIIFFFIFFKNYNEKTYKLEKKYIPLLGLCVLLISSWSLKTYIGLGNVGNLTMFSNLLTEKSRSNHFLIDTNKTKIFDFEEDNVLILKMGDSSRLEQYKLPLIEFKYLASQKPAKKISCTLIYKNETLVIDDLKKSEFAKSKWWYKYVFFRKIQPQGPNKCIW